MTARRMEGQGGVTRSDSQGMSLTNPPQLCTHTHLLVPRVELRPHLEAELILGMRLLELLHVGDWDLEGLLHLVKALRLLLDRVHLLGHACEPVEDELGVARGVDEVALGSAKARGAGERGG